MVLSVVLRFSLLASQGWQHLWVPRHAQINIKIYRLRPLSACYLGQESLQALGMKAVLSVVLRFSLLASQGWQHFWVPRHAQTDIMIYRLRSLSAYNLAKKAFRLEGLMWSCLTFWHSIFWSESSGKTSRHLNAVCANVCYLAKKAFRLVCGSGILSWSHRSGHTSRHLDMYKQMSFSMDRPLRQLFDQE